MIPGQFEETSVDSTSRSSTAPPGGQEEMFLSVVLISSFLSAPARRRGPTEACAGPAAGAEMICVQPGFGFVPAEPI